jgi:hypothetical protein
MNYFLVYFSKIAVLAVVGLQAYFYLSFGQVSSAEFDNAIVSL